jgi:Ca2+-binding EF-hand superfamily protein
MKFVFRESELRDLVKKFREFDADHSDTIDENELNTFLDTVPCDPVMAKAAFRLFDLDKDGALSFAEFALFLRGLDMLRQNPIEFYRLLFKSVDVNDDEHLDSNELALFCNLLGMDESIEEATMLISRLTRDGSSSVTFDELYAGIIQPLANRIK